MTVQDSPDGSLSSDVQTRIASPRDAAQFLVLQQRLSAQSDYLLSTQQEASELSIDRQSQILQEALGDKSLQRILVAETNDQIVGFLGFGLHGMSKVKHIASRVAVGVNADYYRKGIATKLFTHAESLWKLMGISRVEFTVIVENKPAITLYSKLGYQVEGERKESVRKADGTYYDEFYMAKLLQ